MLHWQPKIKSALDPICDFLASYAASISFRGTDINFDGIIISIPLGKKFKGPE
jgi:hypothetical protein